jgi:hypothetical protein
MDTLKPSDAEDLQASIKDPNVKLAGKDCVRLM